MYNAEFIMQRWLVLVKTRQHQMVQYVNTSFKSRFYKALFQTRKLALFPFKKEKDLFSGNLKGVYFLLNLKGAISSGQDNKAQSRMWQGSWLTFSITADH